MNYDYSLLDKANFDLKKGTKFVDLVKKIEFEVAEDNSAVFSSSQHHIYVKIVPNDKCTNKTARVYDGVSKEWAFIVGKSIPYLVDYKFKVGNWYRINLSTLGICFYRCSLYTNDKIYSDCWINKGFTTYSSGDTDFIRYSEILDYDEIDISEFYNLLPEENKYRKEYEASLRPNVNTDFVFKSNGYYVGTWDDKQRCIFKTRSEKLADGTWTIDANNCYNFIKNGACTGDNISFREANSSEIELLDSYIIKDVDNFEEGTVYYVKHGSSEWLVKKGELKFISLSSMKLIKNNNFSYDHRYSYKLATKSQINHFHKCIQTDCYVNEPNDNRVHRSDLKSGIIYYTKIASYSDDNEATDYIFKLGSIGFINLKGKVLVNTHFILYDNYEFYEADEKQQQIYHNSKELGFYSETFLDPKPVVHSMDEILKEAYIRYPIGTEYLDIDGVKYTVSYQNFKIYEDTIEAERLKGILYSKGKWAEVLSKPFEQYNYDEFYVEVENQTQADQLIDILAKKYNKSKSKSYGFCALWTKVSYSNFNQEFCIVNDSEAKSKKRVCISEFIIPLEKPVEDPLITEAKKRYPIGTKFFPAHVPRNKDVYCIVTENSEWVLEDNIICLEIGGGKYVSSRLFRYGNTSVNRYVYYNGKWAELYDGLFEDSHEECKNENYFKIQPLDSNKISFSFITDTFTAPYIKTTSEEKYYSPPTLKETVKVETVPFTLPTIFESPKILTIEKV